MKKLIPYLFLTATIVLVASTSFPANFTVSPIKVYFKGVTRTSAITIRNNSTDVISLQVRVVSWDQDEKGEDHYAPTKDLIAFPKIFRLKNGESQLIRIGLKTAPGNREKTYRIYVKEIPQPQSTPKDGTMLRTFMRLGMPIFVEPVKPKDSAEITGVSLKKNKLLFSVSNTGNRHFIMRSVKVIGKNAMDEGIFTRELAGRYLHSGREKRFSVEIPVKECVKIDHLEIDVSTDRLSMNKRTHVKPELCSP